MTSTSPPSFNIGSINLSGGTFSIVGRDQHNYTQHHYQTLPNPLLAPNFNLQPPPVDPPQPVKKPLRILCLDGGGFKGYISLLILQEILSSAQPGKTPAELFPHQIFDLICGTSTGGLIALLLVKKKFSIQEAITAYQTLGPEIFKDEKGFITALARGERFDSSIVAKVVTRMVGEELMESEDQDSNCRCFVTVRNRHIAPGAGAIYLIRSYRANDTFVLPNGYSWPVAEAARATSAAATYFLPLEIKWEGQSFYFEDAGMFNVNNPSYKAWEEIKKIPEFEGREIGCFLSLGTGLPPTLAKGSANHRPGKVSIWARIFTQRWERIKKLLDELSKQATQTQEVHQQMVATFKEHKLQDTYFRMNPGGADMSFAEWFRGAEMQGLVWSFLQDPDNISKLIKCADLLK